MDHWLPATPELAREFSDLFVNRRAYTIQSVRPHPDSGRHYYYRPKSEDGAIPTGLSLEIVRQHLAGELTIGIYAINPATQRCKWMAIDAAVAIFCSYHGLAVKAGPTEIPQAVTLGVVATIVAIFIMSALFVGIAS